MRRYGSKSTHSTPSHAEPKQLQRKAACIGLASSQANAVPSRASIAEEIYAGGGSMYTALAMEDVRSRTSAGGCSLAYLELN
jgi:hypothetical protein